MRQLLYSRLLLLLLVLPLGAWGQSLDSLLLSAPDAELPLLDRNARLDLLDLYAYRMTARAETRFGTRVTLESLTPNYLRLRLSPAAQWEVLRVALPADTFLLALHTLTLPERESQLRLYSPTWCPDSIQPTLPRDLAHFLPPAAAGEADSIASLRQELQARLQVPAVYATIDTTDVQRPALELRVGTERLEPTLRTRADRWLRTVRLEVCDLRRRNR